MVEAAEVTPPSAAHSSDPLSGLGVGALLDGAARLRPLRPAMADRTGEISYADADLRVSRLASQIAGLQPPGGGPLLLAGGASVTTILLVFAALRAGLDIALAPAYLDPLEFQAFARDMAPELLVADSAALDMIGENGVLSLAADMPSIRLVCATAPIDGGVWLDAERQVESGTPRPARAARLFFPTPEGAAQRCSEADLLSAALDVATSANIGGGEHIVSTLSPASIAGLVAGPLAALLSGASITLQSPFEASPFRAEIAARAPCHIVVPAALERPLVAEIGGEENKCASLIFVSPPDMVVETRGFVPHKCPTFDVTQLRREGCVIARRTEQASPLAALGERMRSGATP